MQSFLIPFISFDILLIFLHLPPSDSSYFENAEISNQGDQKETNQCGKELELRNISPDDSQ